MPPSTVHNHIHIVKRGDNVVTYPHWHLSPGDRIAFHFVGPGYGGNGKLYAKEGSDWPFNSPVIAAGKNGVAVATSNSVFEGTVHYTIEFDLKDGTSDMVDPDMIIDRGGKRSLTARQLAMFESAFEMAELLVDHVGFTPPPAWHGDDSAD